jgi:hypothetical protein
VVRKSVHTKGKYVVSCAALEFLSFTPYSK